MKLCKLKEQKLWANIEGLSVRLEKRGISLGEVISLAPKQRPKTLILIGDGTPDDYVVALFAFKFNSEKLAWLTKPEVERGTAIFKMIHTYLMGGELREILIVIDQEALPESEVLRRARQDLEGKSIRILEEERKGKKLRNLSCSYGGRAFRLFILINGLDSPHFKKHTVEDHLLKAMELSSGGDEVEKILRESGYDPKDAWWNKLEKRRQYEIIEGLFEMEKESLRDIFPQHFEAFGFLK